MALDLYLFHLLNNLAGQSPIADGIIVFFASYLAYILVIVFAVLALFSSYTKREKLYIFAVAAAATLIARFGVAELIRLFYHRPRPFLVEHPVHQLLTDPAWSFPSGHATFFFALAMVAYLYNKKWGVFFFIAAALVTVGRAAAGVHYPSDIIGGALVGVLVAYGTYYLVRKITAPKTRQTY